MLVLERQIQKVRQGKWAELEAIDKKFNEMKKSHVKELIQEIFHKIGGNFNDPTKENLEEVVEHLKKFAKVYRKPEIIKKHVSEIIFLINKIENK